MKKTCKFEISDLLPIGLTLIVAGIGIAYGMNVLGDLKSDQCTGTTADGNVTLHYAGGRCWGCSGTDLTYTNITSCCNNTVNATAHCTGTNLTTPSLTGTADVNASIKAISGVSKIPDKMPLIATVIVAAVIIGILIRYLMVRFA